MQEPRLARRIDESSLLPIRRRDGRHCFYFRYHGEAAIIESEPIRVAKVEVGGEGLLKSVLVAPRYAARTKHEIIEVIGLRRGRTISALLDEPVESEDGYGSHVDFKGVGTDTDSMEMVIHPTLWFKHGRWGRHDEHRMFGAVRQAENKLEFENRILEENGIPQVKHLAFNKMPVEIDEMIAEESGSSNKALGLGQLVRLLPTNVRMDVMWEFPSKGNLPGLPDLDGISKADAKVLLAQQEFAKKHIEVEMDGDVDDNRLVNGWFVDAENYSLKRESGYDSPGFVRETLKASLEFVGNTNGYGYVCRLEEKTDLRLLGPLKNYWARLQGLGRDNPPLREVLDGGYYSNADLSDCIESLNLAKAGVHYSFPVREVSIS